MADQESALSFLDGEGREDPQVEADAQESAEAEADAPEAEAPSDVEGDEATGEDGAPPAPAEKAGSVPLTALSDERKKRQALQAELDELKRQFQAAQQQTQTAPTPEKVPDLFEDPEARLRYHEQQAQRQALDYHLNTSELMAREKHGDQAVETATQAFREAIQKEPWLRQQLQQQRHPYGWIVSWHQQSQVMSEIGSDPAAYRDKVKAEILAEINAQQSQESLTQQSSATPPPSMARAQGVRGATVPKGSAFERAIPQ